MFKGGTKNWRKIHGTGEWSYFLIQKSKRTGSWLLSEETELAGNILNYLSVNEQVTGLIIKSNTDVTSK